MRIDKNPYGWSLDENDQNAKPAKPADEPEESKFGFKVFQKLYYNTVL